MAINRAAARAAQSAASPVIDVADTVNTPAGAPAQEIWPGALDPAPYGPGREYAGSTKGDVYASAPAEPFTSDLPVAAPEGGYQDAAWLTGHDAPQLPWDSSAGEPFAPSGPLDPALHAQDTGGVWIHEHVVPAEIGSLTRQTEIGQTYNQVAPTLETIGQTAINDRQNRDEYQWHDPDGYDPWEIPYSERPVYNNLAYEATGINETGSTYTPAGNLPDLAAHGYQADAYQSPPDPSNSAIPQPASPAGIGGGWL